MPPEPSSNILRECEILCDRLVFRYHVLTPSFLTAGLHIGESGNRRVYSMGLMRSRGPSVKTDRKRE
jgi:hypothetical protein